MTHANPELESAVVGALLDASSRVVRSDVATLLAASGLAPADFAVPLWRLAFRAVSAIAERRGDVTPLAAWASLRSRAGVPEDGLAQLEAAQAGNLLTKAEVLQHAATLRRLAMLRGLQEFHAQQTARLREPDADPAKAALELEQYARTVSDSVASDETAESDVMGLVDSWEASIRGEHEPLLATGIELLDEHIGGWERNLNLLGGLPSIGKSSLLATCIANQLKAGRTIGLFGLEEGTQWFLRRQIAKEAGIPLRNVGRARLTNEQQFALQESLAAWQERLRRLYVYRRGGITTSQMVATAKRWVVAHGVQCVYVDHGGEVEHEGGSASGRRDDLAVAHTYRSMRNLSLNHSVPVVMLAHFSREAYDGRPTLRSFAHTEEIGRMASTALGLWQRHTDELLCDVVKARNGARGTTLLLERYVEAGLVKSRGGRLLDLAEEARAHAEREREQRDSQRRGRTRGFSA